MFKKKQPKIIRMPRGPLDSLLTFQGFLLGFIVICVLGSAMAVVTTKHLNRSLHIQLQKLQQARDTLHVEWSRLLLEQGALGSDARVEKIAREQLGMTLPKSDQIRVIRP
jgi:cell division protein FtsL